VRREKNDEMLAELRKVSKATTGRAMYARKEGTTQGSHLQLTETSSIPANDLRKSSSFAGRTTVARSPCDGGDSKTGMNQEMAREAYGRSE
jgi:hypothetical protein